jgi:hypothetical protein
MSELMDKIMAGKLKTRRALAALPFDQKLDIMEKIRERSAALAENPLRKRRRAKQSGKQAAEKSDSKSP